MTPLQIPLPDRAGLEWSPQATPHPLNLVARIITAKDRELSQATTEKITLMRELAQLRAHLRSYAWSNRLVGFAVGLIVSSLFWIVLLLTFRGPTP